MRLSDFRVLTFDCYGTLIDWEAGITAALQPMLVHAAVQTGAPSEPGTLLQAFARHEGAVQDAAPGTLYPEVLAEVHRRLAEEWGAPADAAADRRFGASVPDWPAFPDSAEALQRLKRHYALVVLSNVDRTSFQASQARLGVAFDAVYTAQDIGSYKPDPANFHYLLDHLASLGFARHDVLHTAQSLFHDHVPAQRIGLRTAWIDRRHEHDGQAGARGATQAPEPGVRFDVRFTTLAAMADAREAEAA